MAELIWIPVVERLPLVNKKVLLSAIGDVQIGELAGFTDDDVRQPVFTVRGCRHHYVTHWSEVPAPEPVPSEQLPAYERMFKACEFKGPLDRLFSARGCSQEHPETNIDPCRSD